MPRDDELVYFRTHILPWTHRPEMKYWAMTYCRPYPFHQMKDEGVRNPCWESSTGSWLRRTLQGWENLIVPHPLPKTGRVGFLLLINIQLRATNWRCTADKEDSAGLSNTFEYYMRNLMRSKYCWFMDGNHNGNGSNNGWWSNMKRRVDVSGRMHPLSRNNV